MLPTADSASAASRPKALPSVLRSASYGCFKAVGPRCAAPVGSALDGSPGRTRRTAGSSEYLEAVRNLREQPIRDVAEYRDRRWWAADIPAHPACVVTSAGEEPWLRVSKAQVPAPPEVPALIAPYLASGVADPESEPAFAAGFEEAFPGASQQHEQELRDALADYIAGPWQEWAPRARLAFKARALYEDLFELRQRLQRDSAMIELVWGYGILTWLTAGSRTTRSSSPRSATMPS
jgi:hypothetical protein